MGLNKGIEEKLNEGRQYRSFDLHAFEHRAEDDGRRIVRGYATTFNNEYTLFSTGEYTVVEKVDPHAFDDCDLLDVIMQYDHEGRVFARTSNNTLAVAADEVGLAIEAELSGTEIGRQLYEEIEGGYTTKMSMGFRVAEDKREVIEDHDNGTVTVIRTITKYQNCMTLAPYHCRRTTLPAYRPVVSVRELSPKPSRRLTPAKQGTGRNRKLEFC